MLTGSLSHFSRRHRPLSQVVRVLISLLIRSHYVYYLRAWHRLGGRGHMKTNFPFSIWTRIKSLTFQLQEKSPTFVELSGSKIDALKTERTQTHFLVMFSLPSSSSSMLKVPICTMTSYYDQQNFSVCCFFVQSGAIFLNLSQGWKDLFTVLAPRTKTKTTGIELTHTCIIPHASALVFVVQEKCRSR